MDQQPLPASGNVHGFLAILLKTDLELTPDAAERAQIMAEYQTIKTVGDAKAYAQKVGAKAQQRRGPRNPVVAVLE